MLIYQEFLAVNEELPAFDPSERLRWAVHEIMMRLKDQQTIKFAEMSKILKNEFKIDISDELLKDIFDRWDKFNDADYSVFKKDDKNWMDVWATSGYVKRKCRDKQSFGKHRKKDFTSSGNQEGYWVGTKWYPYGTTHGSNVNRNRNIGSADDWPYMNPYGYQYGD